MSLMPAMPATRRPPKPRPPRAAGRPARAGKAASLDLALHTDGPPTVTAARTRRADSAVRRLLAATKMLRDLQALVPNGLAPGPRLKVFDPAGRKVG